MRRYHTNIGLPEGVSLLTGWFELGATDHARKKCQMEGITIPNGIGVNNSMYEMDPYEAIQGDTDPHVFEARIEDNEVRVVSVRFQHNESYDQTVVFNYKGSVITTWLDYEDYIPPLEDTTYVTP